MLTASPCAFPQPGALKRWFLLPEMPGVPAQLAQPVIQVGNVLAGGVLAGATSGPASGVGVMTVVVEALVQPAAGVGVGAAVGVVQTGAPNSSGAAGGSACPGPRAGRLGGSVFWGNSGRVTGPAWMH
jgi:hypothetical protein